MRHYPFLYTFFFGIQHFKYCRVFLITKPRPTLLNSEKCSFQCASAFWFTYRFENCEIIIFFCKSSNKTNVSCVKTCTWRIEVCVNSPFRIIHGYLPLTQRPGMEGCQSNIQNKRTVCSNYSQI